MSRTGSLRYWIFQLSGWGIFILINIFFAIAFDLLDGIMVERLFFFVELGILFSHIMRETIKRSAILFRSLQQQIIIFVVLTIIFSLFIGVVQAPFEKICHLRLSSSGKAMSFHALLIYHFTTALTVLFIWNCIYFMYHYVLKSRKQQMDALQLEALVKELELKTIKAHINPHFIFNALNSTRALVDEDPERARSAITELSNILRSSISMSTGKSETVSLKDELKIVRDYLALENMRFEDRLKIEYEVEEDTLEQQVPPMMLQTLVENAIKHGISKQIKGGVVKIISDVKNNYHLLAVQNTGHLIGGLADGGFGLSSTQDRLGLLYGGKAKFEIKQLTASLVEAKVLIPFY